MAVWRTRGTLTLLLLAAVAGSIAIRTFLIAHFSGALIDSDEAVFGLMGRNILSGHVPIFFYGQSYMGSLEAFLAAAWFAVANATPVVLKISTLCWFGAFVFAQYVLIREVVDRETAAMSTVLLLISPAFLTIMSLKTFGYMSLLTIGTCALILTERLLYQGLSASRAALLGLCIGLAWWSHFLAIVYIAPIVLWLVIKYRAELLSKYTALVFVGFVAGSLPFWIYNLFRSWGSFDLRSPHHTPFWPAFAGFFHSAIPIFVGMRPEGGFADFFTGGTVLALALFGVAVIAPILVFCARYPQRPWGIGVLVTFLAMYPLIYAFSGFGGTFNQPRYLLPLYSAFYGLMLMTLPRRLQVVLTAILLVVNVNGSLRISADEMATTLNREPQGELLSFLKAHDVHSVYAPYWIAYRLMFESEGALVCSPPDGMGDRYHPYLVQVAGDPDRAYVEFDRADYQDWVSAPVPAGYSQTRIGKFIVSLPPPLIDAKGR